MKLEHTDILGFEPLLERLIEKAVDKALTKQLNSEFERKIFTINKAAEILGKSWQKTKELADNGYLY